MTTPRSRPVFFVKRLDTRPHLDVALVDDERNPVNLAGATITGLSPRVRENRPLRSLDLRVSGSIPACAGEPLTRTTKCARSTVYPRVCGGTHHGTESAPHQHGLSPRVRGNPLQLIWGTGHFIGNPLILIRLWCRHRSQPGLRWETPGLPTRGCRGPA